ncbi:gamma-glutamyltransferase [Vineibacter terrae]|nr:gamma-glutamyltransferase [Vineibacter terrae]
MRPGKLITPRLFHEARDRRAPRQRAVAALAAGVAVLAACGPKVEKGQPGFVEGFFGAVVADEPLAAEAGRDILAAGGTAADAAVAMYFALSATLPSGASLGAGGVCLVHNAKTHKAEAIIFPSTPAGPATKGFDVATPTAVRGMTLLHVRHGQARWEALVAPGERIARDGASVSRALARDLQAGVAQIGLDPAARRIYEKGGGTAIGEGDPFVQRDLGSSLGSIRARGGVDFFQGQFARQLVDSVQSAGGGLTLQNLREAVASVVEPIQVPVGDHTAYFAPAPFAGSATQAAFTGQGGAGGGAYAGGEAGFAALDRNANAVACTVGMGQLFGARKVAPGTGIMMGAPGGGGNALIGPMLIANRNTGDSMLVGVASGGPGATAALGTVARQVMREGMPLPSALSAVSGAQVGMVACPRGVRENRTLCQLGVDPRSYGLALTSAR